MIIALEGAPATGKSTVAGHMAEHHGATCIEEVNILFDRPNLESLHWYFEQELERMALAQPATGRRAQSV